MKIIFIQDTSNNVLSKVQLDFVPSPNDIIIINNIRYIVERRILYIDLYYVAIVVKKQIHNI